MIAPVKTTLPDDRNAIAAALNPFLDLLKDQKQHTTQTLWLKSVRTLMTRVIETPEQYLPKELAESDTLTGMIRSIFHEFILNQTPFQFSKKNPLHSE